MAENDPGKVERISIDVVALPKDFLREGGIANAINALTVLDAWLDKVNGKFQMLGLDTKSVGGAAGAAKELTSKIQAGIGTVKVPVEFVSKGGDLRVTNVLGSGNEPIARQVKSQMGPYGTSTLHETMGEGGDWRQSKVVQVQNLEAAAKAEAAAMEKQLKLEAAAAEAARLGAQKRESLNIRGSTARAMDDIDPTGLGLLGRAARERTAEERMQRAEQARILRQQRTEAASRRAYYGMEYGEFESAEKQHLAQGLAGVAGTPVQRRAGRAQLEQAYYSSIAGKAQGLAGEAQSAGDIAQALSMQKKYSDAMVEHAKATSRATQATDQFGQSNRLIGKNMLENIKHVSTWAASVGLLYGSLALLRRSLVENMEIGNRMAVLAQIFKGSAAEVSVLTDRVMELAAANGQNATQAVVAATEFARIYHTQDEILQATNSALVLANISGEEAAHTTEFLSAMTQVYKFHASELAAVIGEMAYASQNFNVTNKDLIKGLEATAESAKTAGISFSQLLGFISAGVGATGQSGTAVGNTIKTMVQEMANPEIQQKMRNQSNIEVTQGGYGLKEMPKIFQEMFVAYERMSEAEKRTMLFNTAGRQNATRMAAILDNYVQSQIIAIQAQLNLNSAQQENVKIMDTLKAQTAAMVAEWDKFLKIQGDHGPMQALQGMATALKNLLALVNTPGINMLATLLGASVVATGAKMAITGIGMNMATSEAGGIKGGLAASTLRALSGDLAAAGLIFNNVAEGGFLKLVTQLDRIGMSSLVAQRGMVAFTGTMKAVGAAFAVFSDIVLPLIILAEGITVFNKISSHFGEHPADISNVDILGGKAGAARDSASLLNSAASVLGNPNTPASERVRIGKSISEAFHIDAIGPNALQNIGRESEAQTRLGGIYSDEQIAEQQRALSEANAEVERWRPRTYKTRSSVGAFGGDYSATVKSGDQEKFETAQKNQTQIEQHLRELERDRIQKEIEEGPGFWQMQAVKGLTGGRLGAISSAQGDIFSQMGAVTPLDVHHRELARLGTDARMKEEAFNLLKSRQAGSNPVELELLKTQTAAAQDAAIQSRIAFESQNTPQMEAMREFQTDQGARFKWGSSFLASKAVGMTEGEQMVSEDIAGRGTGRAQYGLQKQLTDLGEVAAAHSVEVGLIELKQRAMEKLLDLEKERHNLLLTEQREFARSLLTSSPSQLLEKLAVSQLMRGGKMSAGSFFALSQGAREDVLRRPGYTEADRMNSRSKAAIVGRWGNATLNPQTGANQWSTNATEHQFSTARYASMAGSFGSPDVTDIHLNAAIVSISALGTAAAEAASRVIQFAQAMESFMAGGRRPSVHAASKGSVDWGARATPAKAVYGIEGSMNF